MKIESTKKDAQALSDDQLVNIAGGVGILIPVPPTVTTKKLLLIRG